jgi:hypothetical protein
MKLRPILIVLVILSLLGIAFKLLPPLAMILILTVGAGALGGKAKEDVRAGKRGRIATVAVGIAVAVVGAFAGQVAGSIPFAIGFIGASLCGTLGYFASSVSSKSDVM